MVYLSFLYCLICRTPRIGLLHHHNKRDKNKETVVDKVMNSSSNYQLQF